MIARNHIYRNALSHPWVASLLAGLLCVARTLARAADFTETIAAVKQSGVGAGTRQRTRSAAIRFAATGFAVGDGLSIITNAHSIPDVLDSMNFETRGIVAAGQRLEGNRDYLSSGIQLRHSGKLPPRVVESKNQLSDNFAIVPIFLKKLHVKIEILENIVACWNHRHHDR